MDDVTSAQIGERIKSIRVLRGLSQAQLAKKISLSSRAYSDIENGHTKIDIERLQEIAKVLNVDPVDLITLADNISFNITDCEHSGHYKPTYNFPKEMKDLYDAQIKELKEEVLFLRSLVKK